MNILIIVFGNYLAASYVSNLFNILDKMNNEGHVVRFAFSDRNMDFLSLNRFFAGETNVPMDGKMEYDFIIFSDMNVMPDAQEFSGIINNNFKIFTFQVDGDDATIPYIKYSDSPPMFCFGMKYGVLEETEYPWFKPSTTSITDSIMGSFEDDVIVLPHRMVRWA